MAWVIKLILITKMVLSELAGLVRPSDPNYLSHKWSHKWVKWIEMSVFRTKNMSRYNYSHDG